MWAFLLNKKYLGFLSSVVKYLHKSSSVYARRSIDDENCHFKACLCLLRQHLRFLVIGFTFSCLKMVSDAFFSMSFCQQFFKVPVYDFSKLDFNFASHFDLSSAKMDATFLRVYKEPLRNAPTVITYYPSVWVKDNKSIVSLNIKWIGVLEV